MDATPDVLARTFEQCASPDVAQIQCAEKCLMELSQSPSFLKSVLEVIQSEVFDISVRQLASIYLKNHVKRLWDLPVESGGLQPQDRTLAKSRLIPITVARWKERLLKPQLTATIAMIAAVDFPSDWKDLVPSLMQGHVLNDANDLGTRRAALEILDVVLQRYRHEEYCNETLSDLKFDILPHVQEPILTVFTESTRRVLALGSNATRTEELDHWFGLLSHSCRIILSLISVDLPEFIEDHMKEFFAGYVRLFDYNNVYLSGKTVQDGMSEGPLEELKSEICRTFALFAARYNEEFEPFVHAAVNAVLQLLLQPNRVNMQALYLDGLVTASMSFLGAASKYQWSPSPFKEPATRLADICEYIVIPNVQLRDLDIELIEDNPQEFIRRTLEGSEADTRRGAAVDLVQALNTCYEKELSCILPNYVSSLLLAASQASTPLERQKIIDAVVYLVIAVVVKAESRAFGVARVNPSVNIQEFFSQHLVTELAVATPPVLNNTLSRAAALKFVATFRNQIDKAVLVQLFPEILKNLNYADPVVHTHAAYCIECLLAARDFVDESALVNEAQLALHRTRLKFSRAELKQSLLAVVEPLFRLIKTNTGIRDNEYLLRCLLRILVFLDTEAASVVLQTLETLRDILRSQCDTAGNPLFRHYLFECIAVCCKICAAAQYHAQMETILLETLSTILSQRDHDFTPYALQVLGVVLDTVVTASPVYINLLNHILAIDQWTISTARVPGIVRVLSAFFRKHNVFREQLAAVMETIMLRFQYCLNHKRLTTTAFDLLSEALHYLPIDFFTPFLHPLGVTLLKRLQAGVSVKLSQQVSLSFAFLDCRSASPVTPRLLNLIQPGLSDDFLPNIYIPSLQKTTKLYEQKVGLLALSRILTTAEVLGNVNLVRRTLEACGVLMGVVKTEESKRTRTADVSQDADQLLLQTATFDKPEEFQGTFSVLQAAKVPVAIKEIDEVSAANFLRHVRQCFECPVVAERVSQEPLWASILPLLASQA